MVMRTTKINRLTTSVDRKAETEVPFRADAMFGSLLGSVALSRLRRA